MAVPRYQKAAVAGDAGWIGGELLLLFLVTMLASSNFSGSAMLLRDIIAIDR